MEEDTNYPALLKPHITHDYQHNALHTAGKWTKYFGSGGCYMYIHILTRDIVSLRPEEYEEISADISNLNTENEIIKDPANGIKRIELSELPAEVDRIIKETNRTPLIFDCSKSQPVRSFYTYKGHLEVGVHATG